MAGRIEADPVGGARGRLPAAVVTLAVVCQAVYVEGLFATRRPRRPRRKKYLRGQIYPQR
jgi:hypothetical protein